jgi:hypothetical protein
MASANINELSQIKEEGLGFVKGIGPLHGVSFRNQRPPRWKLSLLCLAQSSNTRLLQALAHRRGVPLLLLIMDER